MVATAPTTGGRHIIKKNGQAPVDEGAALAKLDELIGFARDELFLDANENNVVEKILDWSRGSVRQVKHLSQKVKAVECSDTILTWTLPCAPKNPVSINAINALARVARILAQKEAGYGSVKETVSVFASVTPEERLRTRIDEKITRIKNLGSNPKAGDDEDTVMDLMGYLALLVGIREGDTKDLQEPNTKDAPAATSHPMHTNGHKYLPAPDSAGLKKVEETITDTVKGMMGALNRGQPGISREAAQDVVQCKAAWEAAMNAGEPPEALMELRAKLDEAIKAQRVDDRLG